jgi:hypothetical protein
MRKYIFFLVSGVLLLMLTGCCGCNTAGWPKEPVLGHMTVTQKKIYLENVRQNLKVFRLTAKELNIHKRMSEEEAQKPCAGQEFRCEVQKYIEVYAMPILADEEARDHVETRLEVAKVNLLSAYAYEETGQDSKARKLLHLFKKRYKKDPSIQNAVVDPAEMGFSRLSEGAATLEAKLITP